MPIEPYGHLALLDLYERLVEPTIDTAMDAWLAEDLGEVGDITTASLVAPDLEIRCEVRARQHGIVAGISVYLIAEGERRGLDVTALLAECNPMYPDARAALIAVEGLSELVDREIPVQGLLNDARNIEERVRDAFARAQSMALPPPDSDDDDDNVPMVS